MIPTIVRRLFPECLRPIGYLSHLVRDRTKSHVQKGPFEGMHYISRSVGSAYVPKLLGIYERELNYCIEEICNKQPTKIVDIGAAEGYYAVGLARRNPQAKVIGFEMEDRGQRALHEMAILNGVEERLEVRGKCEPNDLTLALGDVAHPIVICDVEGYENKLLDPVNVPALKRASILVELHDFIVPQVTELLKGRFQATHDIEHIWQEPRSRDEFPFSTFYTYCLPSSYLDWTVSEWRPVRMAWLWMQPKTK